MFDPAVALEIAQIRADLACQIRSIAVRSNSRKFELYIESILKTLNPYANVYKASPLLGSSLDQIDLEMLDDLYNVYLAFAV
jgi:hypothetical protein